jgi:hypothetical protein
MLVSRPSPKSLPRHDLSPRDEMRSIYLSILRLNEIGKGLGLALVVIVVGVVVVVRVGILGWADVLHLVD